MLYVDVLEGYSAKYVTMMVMTIIIIIIAIPTCVLASVLALWHFTPLGKK